MRTIESVSNRTSSITRVRLSAVLIAIVAFTLYAIDGDRLSSAYSYGEPSPAT